MADQSPFQARFDAAMAHVGAATRAKFGAMLGVSGEGSGQKLYNWYRRDQRIPDDQRKPLAALGLSIDWINDNEGQMLISAPVAGNEIAGGYLRVAHLDAEGDMGDGRINADFPDVIRSIDLAEPYIRSIVGFLPPPGRLVIITGRGDSMIPTIQPGEALIVDTGIGTYDGDGLYLINLGHGQQVKRLIDHGMEAGIHVHSDNSAYPAIQMPAGAIIGGKVYLRNRIDRLN